MLSIIIAISVLLLMSAFFSGSETALTATSQPLIHQMAQNGDKRAQIVNQLHKKKERLIGAILLGNNLVNILASALATSLMITTFGELGVVYATISMALLVLIFAEILPKTYAIKFSTQAALSVAKPISFIVMILAPVTASINFFVHGMLRMFGVDVGKDDCASLVPSRSERNPAGKVRLPIIEK